MSSVRACEWRDSRASVGSFTYSHKAPFVKFFAISMALQDGRCAVCSSIVTREPAPGMIGNILFLFGFATTMVYIGQSS